MNRGELLTRTTIWIALAGYTFGAAYFITRGGRRWEFPARLAWTASCLCLLAHVSLAFHYFHGWSHLSAQVETARQTAEVFGIYWGGGLIINYVLILAWMIDVVWWWGWPERYRRRPQLLTVVWHGFLLFIVFNATVVFGSGPVRWAGVVICGGLACCRWFGGATRTPDHGKYVYGSPNNE